MRRLVLLLLVLLAVPAQAAPRPGFRWPLAGTPAVERGFAPPQSAWGAGHRGVDLKGYAGQPVVAAGAGRVTYAGLLAGRGVVTVTHAGGLRTTYEPVRPAVRVGQSVAAGDLLGHLAPGGHCPDACLHWGLLRGNDYLDPLALLTDLPVRLLPLGTPASPVAELRTADRSGGSHPTGTLAAAGTLAVGLPRLASRRRPAPLPPPPGDLSAERARRRAA